MEVIRTHPILVIVIHKHSLCTQTIAKTKQYANTYFKLP